MCSICDVLSNRRLYESGEIAVEDPPPPLKIMTAEQALFRFAFRMSVKNMFTFDRKQFPVRMAYAGTVHRFQGDTILERMLVDCRHQSFAHGQLSVAMSRATGCAKVTILAEVDDVTQRSIQGLIYRELITFDEMIDRAHADVMEGGTTDDILMTRLDGL